MIKTLLKRQFLETASFFFYSQHDHEKRKPSVVIAVVALMAYAVVASFIMLYKVAQMLCEPLVASGLAWVYFAFAGLMAFGVGAIGSIFFAKSKIFEAKDNDLLLSMPIPAWAVLFSRMVTLYAFTFLFTAIAWFPAVAQYFVVAGFQPLALLGCVAVALLLPFGTLAICSFIGWLIALITAKIRAKTVWTTVFFALFMVLYFYLIGKANEYLGYIITHGDKVGETLKKIYPFYKLGLSATGEGMALLSFSAMCLGAFAITYFVISKTFIRVVTTKGGERAKRYDGNAIKSRTPFTALFMRESKRCFSNPMIFLNCVLGSVFLLTMPIVALFNAEFCQTLSTMDTDAFFALLLCAIVGGLCATNTLSSSSVSLEGDTLWIVRSMPVHSWTVLQAKLAFHFVVTAIPAVFCAIFLAVCIELGALWTMAVVVIVCVLVFLFACVGLVFNLKLPNLQWTNEMVAVKQGLATILSMLTSIGIIALPILLYKVLGEYVVEWVYLLGFGAIFLVASVVLYAWLKKNGDKIFDKL